MPIWFEYATRHCAIWKSRGERSVTSVPLMIAPRSVSGMKMPESPTTSWSRKLRALVWKLSTSSDHPRNRNAQADIVLDVALAGQRDEAEAL